MCFIDILPTSIALGPYEICIVAAEGMGSRGVRYLNGCRDGGYGRRSDALHGLPRVVVYAV